MLHIRLIKYFYIGLTILAIISPVKFIFWEFLPGLVLMWILFIFYWAGISKKEIDFTQYKIILTENKSSRFTIMIIIAYLIFYPIYIKFYSGLDISKTLSNVFSGISNYSTYQSHFAGENLNQFSLSKLPYIIGHGLLRFIFIGIVFKNIIYKSRSSIFDIFSIVIMVIFIIIVGLARGTSYEFFEVFIIFFFAIMMKRALSEQKKLISRKMLFGILIVAFAILIFFAYNIQTRMGGLKYYKDTRFDRQALLYLISEPVAKIFFPLYDYFLFGLHFTSLAIKHLWFSSFKGFISIFIPQGITILGLDISYRNFVGQFINLRTSWTPDTIKYIEGYGIIVTLLLVYFIGRISRKLYCAILTNVPASILLFYSCYFMFSLPLGNLITASSANLICIFTAIFFYKFNYLNRYFFKM